MLVESIAAAALICLHPGHRTLPAVARQREATRDTEAAIWEAGFEFERLARGFHSSSVLTITSAPYIHGVAKRS